MRRHFTALLFAAVTFPTSAWASGSVLVSLQDDGGRPVEGMATATPEGGGPARTCSTQGGRCTILGLPAGRYRVGASLLRGGIVPAGLVFVTEGRAASVRLTSVSVSPAPVQQHGAGGQRQGHGPV